MVDKLKQFNVAKDQKTVAVLEKYGAIKATQQETTLYIETRGKKEKTIALIQKYLKISKEAAKGRWLFDHCSSQL